MAAMAKNMRVNAFPSNVDCPHCFLSTRNMNMDNPKNNTHQIKSLIIDTLYHGQVVI